jgi:zinc protease
MDMGPPALCRFAFAVLFLGAGAGLVAAPPSDPGADAAGPSRAAEQAALRAAAALYEGVRTETLANGLRVFLKPIPGAPVVSTMVAYKVGSADEELDHTGLSHYLEHLMFKGTDKILPGDIDRLTLRNGGANNAYTSNDYTVYHFDFAADRWEVALEVEADRMRNLRIDARHEFEQEKGAVIEELQRNEDEPWDLEGKAILPLLFGKTTPYGHPVIGEREHVRDATAAVIKAHYDRWYHPNNAALVVCGGFDPERALAKIRQLFGPLPKGTLPERKPAPERPRRPGVVRHEISSKFAVPRLVMGFNTVRIGEPDFYVLEVLQALLSTGKTSRLYKALVEGAEIATVAESGNNAGRYPGWFSLYVELLKGKDRRQAEDLVLAELKRLGDQPVSPAELSRVQRGLLTHFIFERESVHNLADSLARGVTTNDLNYLKEYLPRIAAVTPQDVQRVARKYFDPDQRVVVWSVPKNEGTGPGRQGTVGPAAANRGRRSYRSERPGRAAGEPGAGTAFSLKDTLRVQLDNGLTLLLFENRRLPIVVADAYVRETRLREPADKAGVLALTGRLLDEGTAQQSGERIAELIEDAGGSLSLHASGGSVKVLAPDRALGLRLLFECLSQAAFPTDAFTRSREQLLSEIEEAEHQPETKAALLYRSLIYGPHPFGRPALGLRPTVETLTREDCAAFHRQVFVPNNTVVAIAGDFDRHQVVAEVPRLTAGWKKAPLPRPALPDVSPPKGFTQKIVTLPRAAQLHFFLGHLGIRRDNPDYYKLLVMDYVLGTGPGFTDRLSARLRDREGLAYTVSANITASASEVPGLFTCYIGTAPANFARVKGTFLEELARIRAEKPKPEEVEDAKSYLQGSLPFQFTTNERIAAQLLSVERHGLGFGYLDAYRQAVAAVTPDEVQAVAQKYLDPQRMVLVAAGAVDQAGKALESLPPPRP